VASTKEWVKVFEHLLTMSADAVYFEPSKPSLYKKTRLGVPPELAGAMVCMLIAGDRVDFIKAFSCEDANYQMMRIGALAGLGGAGSVRSWRGAVPIAGMQPSHGTAAWREVGRPNPGWTPISLENFDGDEHLARMVHKNPKYDAILQGFDCAMWWVKGLKGTMAGVTHGYILVSELDGMMRTHREELHPNRNLYGRKPFQWLDAFGETDETVRFLSISWSNRLRKVILFDAMEVMNVVWELFQKPIDTVVADLQL